MARHRFGPIRDRIVQSGPSSPLGPSGRPLNDVFSCSDRPCNFPERPDYMVTCSRFINQKVSFNLKCNLNLRNANSPGKFDESIDLNLLK